MDFKLEQRDFARQIDRLARATRKETKDVLRQQARLFVADAAALTPPTGNTPLGAEGVARNPRSLPGLSLAARKQGQDAVARDARKLFANFEALEISKSETKLAKSVRVLMKQARFDEAKKLLEKAGLRFDGVVAKATVDTLNRHRDAKGRVIKGRRVLVRDGRSILSLTRAQQKLVGRAKAGWKKAAEALGFKLPAWIGKHEEPGIFSTEGGGDRTAYVVGNALSYAQKMDASARIMARAYRNRLKLLPKQLEHALRASARKSGARASG